jgi:hypothetical protein
MTPQQADWLRKNRKYRVVGQLGGTSRYIQRGLLHADGEFESLARGQRPARVTAGDFEVGILETPVPGQIT